MVFGERIECFLLVFYEGLRLVTIRWSSMKKNYVINQTMLGEQIPMKSTRFLANDAAEETVFFGAPSLNNRFNIWQICLIYFCI